MGRHTHFLSFGYLLKKLKKLKSGYFLNNQNEKLIIC